MMLSIYISYFLVLLGELHVVIVEFIVVDYFIDLLDPLVIHEHFIEAVGYSLFSGYELLVLRL